MKTLMAHLFSFCIYFSSQRRTAKKPEKKLVKSHLFNTKPRAKSARVAPRQTQEKKCENVQFQYITFNTATTRRRSRLRLEHPPNTGNPQLAHRDDKSLRILIICISSITSHSIIDRCLASDMQDRELPHP
jgi:hypothetical protein